MVKQSAGFGKCKAYLVVFVEGDVRHAIEQTALEVRGDHHRFGPQTQNLKQSRIRHEVKPGKLRALRIKKRSQAFLTQLQLVREIRQQGQNSIAAVTNAHHL